MLIHFHLFRPQLPSIVIARDRLMDLISQVSSARVIAIEAPAGYGKSIAVAEVVQRMAVHYAWYPLEYLDHKTSLAFVWNLVRAIQVGNPEFGRQIESILHDLLQSDLPTRDPDWLRNTILPALVGEITRLTSSLWIVLDNYHEIHSDEIDEAMIYLIDRAPDNTHFVVTSRNTLQWSARPRWEGRGTLATITTEDLALTTTESGALATAMGVRLSPEQIDWAHRTIGGWPVLQALVFRRLRGADSTEISRFLTELTLSSNVVYDYLYQELLREFDGSVRDFLCRTSILRRLDAVTCNALLDTMNADQILNRLGTSLFLRPERGPEGSSFLHRHDIFREFLQQVMYHEYSQDVINHLYTRLGEVYESENEWEKAITYYCHAEQPDKVSLIIRQQAAHLIDASDIMQLEIWLKQVPKHWLEQDPVLLIYQGIVFANKRNLAFNIQAENCLAKARQLAEERGDLDHVALADIELGWLSWLTHQYTRALNIVGPILKQPFMPAWLRVRGLHCLSMVSQGLDHYSDAIEFAQQALTLYRQLNMMPSAVRMLRHLSSAYVSIGQLQAALKALGDAYHLSRALQLGDWAVAWNDNQWAQILIHLGLFDEARMRLDEADALMAKHRQLGSQSDLLDFILITRGHLHRDTYDYQLAENLYRSAGRGLHETSNGVILALRLTQTDRNQEALDLAQISWRKHQGVESPVRRAKYQVLLGLAYVGVGNRLPALSCLEQSAKTLMEHGAIYDLTAVQIYLAQLYFALDMPNRGLACLDEAMKWMARNECYNLDIWLPWAVAEMCAVALRHRIVPDFVEGLAIRRLTSAHANPFLPLVNSPQQDVRDRAIRILRSQTDTLRLTARELLNTCKHDATRRRLVNWLDSGWLKELALISLAHMLSWRELETFLAWIYPPFDGSIERISNELVISVDTVNRHLQNSRRDLEEAGIVAFAGGKNARMEAYGWAVRSQFIDPYAST